MNYRSIADLSHCIRENIYKLPGDIDLVVGVPRSGVLAASIIGLNLNIRLVDFESYVADTALALKNTRQALHQEMEIPSDAKHVLIVDDSIATGATFYKIRDRVLALNRQQKITYCAIYAMPSAVDLVDIHLEVLSVPRTFEWNILHRPLLANCCVDIDGIFCIDPTTAQNDDGEAYLDFLRTAPLLARPTYPVGHIVTSRLERYRKETEDWLARQRISYVKLHMLDLPDAQTRRRLGCHARFKAEVYRELSDTVLFIESEPRQACEIAKLAGKPAICFKTQELYKPGISYALLRHKTQSFRKVFTRRMKRIVTTVFNR